VDLNTKKILIFGNSGSGKSTLAKQLVESNKLSHLDLDTLAWASVDGKPVRLNLEDSFQKIQSFTQENESWVIEGCYSDLLELIKDQAQLIVYMDLPIDLCIVNAKNRPWEAHKYESKKAQDANLSMLISWIQEYEVRDDTFSRKAHSDFYDSFQGDKVTYKDNNI